MTIFAIDAPEWPMAVRLTRLGKKEEVREYVRRETCQMEYSNEHFGWRCMACGRVRIGPKGQKPRYCPCCGRMVI